MKLVNPRTLNLKLTLLLANGRIRMNIPVLQYSVDGKTCIRFACSHDSGNLDILNMKLKLVLANGHITLNIPVLVRSLKSSNVEPG